MVTDKPVHQLRIYEIFDKKEQAFHERFRERLKKKSCETPRISTIG